MGDSSGTRGSDGRLRQPVKYDPMKVVLTGDAINLVITLANEATDNLSDYIADMAEEAPRETSHPEIVANMTEHADAIAQAIELSVASAIFGPRVMEAGRLHRPGHLLRATVARNVGEMSSRLVSMDTITEQVDAIRGLHPESRALAQTLYAEIAEHIKRAVDDIAMQTGTRGVAERDR